MGKDCWGKSAAKAEEKETRAAQVLKIILIVRIKKSFNLNIV
jgi:hypothetical protein